MNRQPMTIRRRLMIDLLLLLVLTGGIILVATWITGYRTIESLSKSLIDQTSNRTEKELQRFFGTLNSNVLAGRGWAENGILDATDHEAMNALFVPILEQYPQLSSMMVADSDGAEYLLLRDPADPNTWTNRIVQADKWGTKVLNRKWNSETGKEDESFGELEYDPRKRIWYERALETTADEPVFWTKPVIFFITKDPGITASTHFVTEAEPEKTLVVAYDLLLMDISKFTSRLKVSERGKAFVLVEDKETNELKVIGLPSDDSLESDASIRDALIFLPPESAVADSDAQLPPPESLESPSVELAIHAWNSIGRPDQPLRFAANGENWWGGLRNFPLGDNTFWIGVVVPENDLSSGIRFQQLVLLGIVGGVLLIGLFRAVTLARRFSTPIELIVSENALISEGNLEPGKPIESDITEIRSLAEGLNTMREGLKSVIKLEKLERDLDIAREIQFSLLPKELPDAPGFEIAGWNRPADKTGGDYFDWLTLADGRTLFTLADVTGHGIGPALIVPVYRAYMRASAAEDDAVLSTILGRVNDLLCVDVPDGRFITAVMGLISPEKHQIEMLSAGQAPLLFYEAGTDKLRNWDADDVPLGIADGVEFEKGRIINFAPGDILVLTSDGFFEAANSADEQFGIEAVENFIRENHEMPPEDFIQKLYSEVKAHAAGEAQADDLTAVVIKRSVEG